MDGDGRTDLIYADPEGSQLVLQTQTERGTFASPRRFPCLSLALVRLLLPLLPSPERVTSPLFVPLPLHLLLPGRRLSGMPLGHMLAPLDAELLFLDKQALPTLLVLVGALQRARTDDSGAHATGSFSSAALSLAVSTACDASASTATRASTRAPTSARAAAGTSSGHVRPGR